MKPSQHLRNMYNRPLRKRVLEQSGAVSGADMYPASVAAIITPRARMVFAGRVQIKAACSMALCCALVLPIPSHDRAPNVSLPSSAPTSSRPVTAYAAAVGDW